jgi:hypothetical protein
MPERRTLSSVKFFRYIAITLLIVVLSFQFVSLSGSRKESERLSERITRLADSLAFGLRELDSLRAQAPGLGDYMSTIQLHAAKLWFAGQASNWPLAKYEHDELRETIEAAEALHARKNNVDVSAVLQSVRQTQLPLVERAISRKSPGAFKDAYSQTLSACNGCHRPAGYEFIHIIPPTREPVTNQRWK